MSVSPSMGGGKLLLQLVQVSPWSRLSQTPLRGISGVQVLCIERIYRHG